MADRSIKGRGYVLRTVVKVVGSCDAVAWLCGSVHRRNRCVSALLRLVATSTGRTRRARASVGSCALNPINQFIARCPLKCTYHRTADPKRKTVRDRRLRRMAKTRKDYCQTVHLALPRMRRAKMPSCRLRDQGRICAF